MPRYIDVDFLAKFPHWERIVKELECAPIADAQEVKHAKWIKASEKSNVGMKCSNCSARIKYSEYFNGNHMYCHKCGVKMDL